MILRTDRCPFCGSPIANVFDTETRENAVPNDGDTSVCNACFAPLVYKTGQYLPASPNDFRILLRNMMRLIWEMMGDGQ